LRSAARLPHLTDRAVEEAAAYVSPGPTAGAGARWQIVAELPFEPARAYHATLGRDGDAYELCVKGAPEVVLERCSRTRTGVLDARGRARLEGEAHRLAHQGLRVLAVARRAKTTNGGLGDEHVRELEFAGFVGLSDPVRESARPAIRALR
jgi:cation-transporting ATPase I